MPEKFDRGGQVPGGEKSDIIARENKRLKKLYKKMETAKGIREVVAPTMYGHGEAKCRDCGEVVNYNVSDSNVSIKPVKTWARGSYLVNPREVEAFEFSIPCPKDQKKISLGKFRKGIGLDKVDTGDIFSDGNYLSEIAKVYGSEDIVRLFIEKYGLEKEEDEW